MQAKTVITKIQLTQFVEHYQPLEDSSATSNPALRTGLLSSDTFSVGKP